MPADALILSLFICCVFAVFAIVLAWADHSTTAWLRAKETKKTKETKLAESPGSQPAKKAA